MQTYYSIRWGTRKDVKQTGNYIKFNIFIHIKSSLEIIDMDNNGINAYLNQMFLINKRMDAILNIGLGEKSTLFKYTNIEFMTLQIRKIIEHIAMANLIVNKDLYSRYNEKFASNWNARCIFRGIEKINPRFYPEPVKTNNNTIPKQWIKVDNYLTKDEAVDVYDKCGALMHVSNPYRAQIDINYYDSHIHIWYNKILNLLNQHIIQLVDEEKLLCIVMRGDEKGMPHGYEFIKVDG